MKSKKNNLKLITRDFSLKSMIEDAVIMLIRCLIATILCSVCIQNGWIFYEHIIDVSHDMFWKIYSAIFVLIPVILFYKGFAGKYNIVVEEYIATPPLGEAKMVDESDKCNFYR